MLVGDFLHPLKSPVAARPTPKGQISQIQVPEEAWLSFNSRGIIITTPPTEDSSSNFCAISAAMGYDYPEEGRRLTAS